jgi:hypothetical protein
MKKLTNHNIYEVWCEYTAESAYIDHKPDKTDLLDLRCKMGWIDTYQYIPYKLHVSKLKPFYGSGKIKKHQDIVLNKNGKIDPYSNIQIVYGE